MTCGNASRKVQHIWLSLILIWWKVTTDSVCAVLKMWERRYFLWWCQNKCHLKTHKKICLWEASVLSIIDFSINIITLTVLWPVKQTHTSWVKAVHHLRSSHKRLTPYLLKRIHHILYFCALSLLARRTSLVDVWISMYPPMKQLPGAYLTDENHIINTQHLISKWPVNCAAGLKLYTRPWQ